MKQAYLSSYLALVPWSAWPSPFASLHALRAEATAFMINREVTWGEGQMLQGTKMKRLLRQKKWEARPAWSIAMKKRELRSSFKKKNAIVLPIFSVLPATALTQFYGFKVSSSPLLLLFDYSSLLLFNFCSPPFSITFLFSSFFNFFTSFFPLILSSLLFIWIFLFSSSVSLLQLFSSMFYTFFFLTFPICCSLQILSLIFFVCNCSENL